MVLAVVADVVAVAAAVVAVDAVENPVLGWRSPHSLHRATMNNTENKNKKQFYYL